MLRKNSNIKIWGCGMYQVHKPKHIGGEYPNSILIKVCPNWNFLMDFVSGKFFMNTSNWFSKNENEKNLTSSQFDYLEDAKLLLNATEDVDLVIDFTEKEARIIQGKHGAFKYNGTPIVNTTHGRKAPSNIYCLYSVWHGHENATITKVDDRIRTGFGEYFAIILNKEEFLNRVERAAKKLLYKLNSNIQYGFVNYINTKSFPSVNLDTFIKDEKFIYQNEFRIALELDREPAPLQYFEVGDLSDIVLIGKTKYLLQIKLEDNCIHIGKSQIPVKWKAD